MRSAIISVLNATPLPQVIVGANFRISAANAAARALLGEGIESRHYVTALRQPALVECTESVLSGERHLREARYEVAGALRETVYRVVVGRVELEAGPGVLISFMDITDLQEAGQMRRDFVANVSHELRTPLTALIGFIETLRGAARDDPAARDRFLQIMETEAGRMNRLIRDLLSLSRVESEVRVRPRGRADLAALVRSTGRSLRQVAEEAGVTLILINTEEAAELPGDADQLSQVLNNLVENAIKYGGPGAEVRVSISRSTYSAEVLGPAVVVSVEDTGDGFDPVHIPRLTERFYRVDNHRSREKGGTGLGLAIVKHIVNRHRGRLKIASAPGQGTRVDVILPEAAR